jgi:5-methylthioadenosine/S-adenosylhomocysteine deaminase
MTNPATIAHLVLPEWLVPVQPHGQVLRDHGVAITQAGTIGEIAPRQALLAQYPNVPRTELPKQILTPGLINLHTHAAMSLLRGAADDLPLHQWLNTRIWPLEGKLVSADFVYDGSLLAGAEMLLNGVTCFNDMYFYPEQTARAAIQLGMRAQVGIAVVEFPTSYGTGPAEYLRKGLQARDSLRGEALVGFTLAPHAPYTIGNQTFQDIASLSQELGMQINCHIHETLTEINDSIKEHGIRPIARLASLGVIGPELIAIHCVHLNQAEIDLLAKYGVSIAHCPHSNLKLASGIAPIPSILSSGITLGIGTDGSASNNRLDLLSEARTASLLAKGSSGDAQLMSAAQTLRHMTLDAAKALGLHDQIGSIELGKSADLVSFDLSGFQTQPVFDPISQLVFACTGSQAHSVWIKGQLVVLNRQLVATGAQQALSEVTARLGLWHNRAGEIESAVA